MSAVQFRQCELVKGSRVQVAWIPAKFAVIGKYVELKGENGWRVTHVGEIILNEDQRSILTQRQHLPSIQ